MHVPLGTMSQHRGTFGPYLQKRLDDKGWNMSELARRAEVHQTLVGRWIRGETAPSVDNARSVADALGRPTAEVLVAAGILRDDEVALQQVTNPADLTDDELLAEVGRRMKTGARRPPKAADRASAPDRYAHPSPPSVVTSVRDHREPGRRGS